MRALHEDGRPDPGVREAVSPTRGLIHGVMSCLRPALANDVRRTRPNSTAPHGDHAASLRGPYRRHRRRGREPPVRENQCIPRLYRGRGSIRAVVDRNLR